MEVVRENRPIDVYSGEISDSGSISRLISANGADAEDVLLKNPVVRFRVSCQAVLQDISLFWNELNL